MFTVISAAQASGSVVESPVVGFLPILLICAIFYLLVIRPHQIKIKKHKKMVDDLVEGDKVLTSGGLIGTIRKVLEEDQLSVEVAENVQITLVRSAVMEVLKQAAVKEN